MSKFFWLDSITCINLEQISLVKFDEMDTDLQTVFFKTTASSEQYCKKSVKIRKVKELKKALMKMAINKRDYV